MDSSLKNVFLERWTRYFPGAGNPILLFYSDELHAAEPVRKFSGHHCMIADLLRVFRGAALAFGTDNMGCAGGRRYCGFSDTLRPEFGYFLSYGIPGKLEGERYKKDPETVAALMQHVPLSKAPAKWLIAKPFEHAGEEDHPEVVLFFATPDVLAGLFTLANFDRKDLYGVKAPFCAGCGSVVQYPVLENGKDDPDCILGMFDASARPHVPAGTLSFAIPFKRFEKLVAYMDESFLITATWKTIRKRIAAEEGAL
ncbi:MAG TPA: DUF169 domain-containing protein [Bacteroidales bacterium]|nr:DUF169 domain-containing protein [Bacteroidales bacterium]HSA44885.1 DUF169 domain-containing protein [Bacteroidales bacterium]